MSVTNSQRVHHHKTNRLRPVHAYQKLPEFAIKLIRVIKAISAFAQYDGTQ